MPERGTCVRCGEMGVMIGRDHSCQDCADPPADTGSSQPSSGAKADQSGRPETP